MPTTPVLLIGLIVIALIAAGAFIMNRLKIVGPDEALVISGAKKDGATKVVSPGGKAFIIPVIHKATRVSLRQYKADLPVEAPDSNNIPVNVSGQALYKVGNTPELIRAAAERFAQDGALAAEHPKDILNGSLRAIISKMSVEELMRDRDGLAASVRDTAAPDLEKNGFIIDSLNITGISDNNNYIKNLSVRESERVAAEARINAAKEQARAREIEVENEQKIAEKDRDLAIRKAQLKAETDVADAEAQAAGDIAAAEQQARVTTEQQQVAEQNAILRERQLVAEVNKPADARLYETRQQAEADRARIVAESEAQAAAIKTRAEADRARVVAEAEAQAAAIEAKGLADAKAIEAKIVAEAEAEARAVEVKGLAEAKAVEATGLAQAKATEATGLAEAKAIDAKAEAMKKFNDAAVKQMVIDKLPEIIREFAAPMASIDNLSIVSTDGAGALPKTIVSGMTQLDGLLEPLLGGKVSDIFGSKILGGGQPEVTVTVPASTEVEVSENGAQE